MITALRTRDHGITIGVILTAWLIINAVQAGITGLDVDEAYYWMYSRFPDWGYFDHPPMVALLIRFGYALFRSEFGVRLFAPILSTLSLLFAFNLTTRKDPLVFGCIAFSTSMLRAGGFLMVPDVALGFFTCLFLYYLRKYLEDDNVRTAAILSVVVALMLYSKYHGFLMLLFTLAAIPRLFTRKTFWLIPAFATILFLPHIFWQVQHGFPSVRFHLQDRWVDSYSGLFTLQYVVIQLIVLGPFISFLLLPAVFRYRVANDFERALKFCALGILAFFLLATLRGPGGSQWTAPALIPILVLASDYLSEHQAGRRWLFALAVPSILLMVFLRIQVVHQIADIPYDVTRSLRGSREFALTVQTASHGLPLGANSYEVASILSFYTGTMVPSLNIQGRHNQFDFWDLELPLRGKDVCFVSGFPLAGCDTLWNPIGQRVFVSVIRNFGGREKLAEIIGKSELTP